MTSAQMIKEIVEGLNKHPFSMKTSLVAFDQEKPQGLLEILGKVLAYVDPERHKVDIQNESPESFFLRVAEAVHVLGYNASFDGEFERSFLSGEKDTVHPILHWLLTNLDHHKKRAYLAKFLVNIEIPTDFLAKDSQLADAYHEYKELQEKFKIFHSSTEQAESSSGGFSECKHEIQRLEKEKFLLCEKIEKLKQKPETETHLTNFLSVARELRAAQLEETTLAFRSQQQTDYFNYLSEQLDTTRKLLQALQALSGDPERGAAAYLKVLRQEERRTAEALAACIRELQQKQERLAEVNAVASGPPPRQEALVELQCALTSLQEETHATEDASSEEAEETNEKITVYKKQLQILIEKKKALEREVRNELAAQQCATMKRSAAENEFRNARGYCFMSKDEFATYAEMLRQKTSLFKMLKMKEAEAETARAEVGAKVAAMKEKNSSIQKAIEELVRERGVHGFQERQTELQSLSETLKTAVREKTEVLQRLDELRIRIEKERAEGRDKLAPLLEKLDRKKQEEAELKRVYDAKKTKYLGLKAELEKPLESLRATVAALQAETEKLVAEREESNSECKTAERLLERAEKEQKCEQGQEAYSAQHATFSAFLQAAIARAGDQAESLRQEHRQLLKTEAARNRQCELLNGLLKILEAKLEWLCKQGSVLVADSQDTPTRICVCSGLS